MEDVLQAISQVGFPIAIACYALYMNYKNQASANDKQLKATEEHTKVLAELKLLIETLVK